MGPLPTMGPRPTMGPLPTMGPRPTMGPTTMGPMTMGPMTMGPTTMGPRPTMGPTTMGPTTMGPANMRSTAGEPKFTLYNEGPTCNVTISDGSNKSRVLLSKKFNTKDYVGPIVIPAGVTSLYCSSSLGKFKLITVKQGINYITLNSSGFSIDYSSALETQNYGSMAGEARFTLYNEGPTCNVTISDGDNKSRVLLSKKFNIKDYVGPIVIPAGVTSLYCSSSLGKFKLISVKKGINYITLNSSGFSLDLSSGSQMHNYGSTVGEAKFSLYNQGPSCTVTIKDGNNSRVLLNKEVNKKDYVGHVVIPADVTSLYCSSSLGKFKLIPLTKGKIQYIIYLYEDGFEFEAL